MKHTKAIIASIIISLVFVLLIVEIAPEIQRVSDKQAEIKERNAEIRAEKVSSLNEYEQKIGKLPTLEDCEMVNSGSPPEMRDKCQAVWRMIP